MEKYSCRWPTILLARIGALISLTASGQTQIPPMARMSAVIYGGNSLKSDGLGPFVDGVKESGVFGRVSLNLLTWNHLDATSNVPYPDAKAPRERWLIFDLSRPVPGSGAKRLEQPFDELARFHVFWKHQHETETIVPPSAIPVGTTVETDRVEMWTRINGIQHVLQMGPWGMGEFSPRALIHGKGTSKAKIASDARSCSCGLYLSQKSSARSAGI